MPQSRRARGARAGRGRASNAGRAQGAPPQRPEELVERALAARAGLLSDPRFEGVRLFNGAADGIDGLVVEQLGPVLIAQLHEGRIRIDESTAARLCEQMRSRLAARAVYRKVYPRDRSAALASLQAMHTDPRPWLGERAEAEFPIREASARLLVRPYDGYATGLFLEQRENRERVRALATGRRVLNCFAYTCGFSVFAALGGAAETVSVDISRRCLDWGWRNFALNELSLEGHRFVVADVLDYFGLARRRGWRFDVIILDPPTFARVKQTRSTFVLDERLDELLGGACELLSPGGHVLLCTNDRRLTFERIESALKAACGGRGRTERLAPAADFAGDPDYSKSVLAHLVG